MLPMHRAARENAVEEMQNLIVTGKYDINEKDSMKRTPLHMASWAGNAEIVKLLLRSKAKTDAIANDNFTALHFATNVEIIKLLVKSNKSLLHGRVSKGNKTALHIAVPKGNIEIIQCLIDLGSDVTAKTSNGQSCLELAKDDGVYSLIKTILQNKIEKQQEIIERRTIINSDDVYQQPTLDSEKESIIEDCDLAVAPENQVINPTANSRAYAAQKTVDEITIVETVGDQGSYLHIQTNTEFEDQTPKEIASSSVLEKVNGQSSLLGKKVILTSLQRRKKKLKTSGSSSSIMLSHLEDEEQED